MKINIRNVVELLKVPYPIVSIHFSSYHIQQTFGVGKFHDLLCLQRLLVFDKKKN